MSDSFDQDWPRCACGCGEAVPARKANCSARGYVKGEPCKYVAGHSNRCRIIPIIDGRKLCTKCGTEKPTSEFNRNKNRTHGLDQYCRACMSAKHREYNRRNKSKRTAKAREIRRGNPERHRKNVARWRERNYEKYLARSRVYAAARRARRRDQFVENVDALAVYERDRGVCGICGGEVDAEDFHVDHIVPLSRGGEHSYANTQTAHPGCNMKKHNTHPEAVAA